MPRRGGGSGPFGRSATQGAAILVALALMPVLAIPLAGCGDDGSGSEGAPSATTAAETDPSSATGPTATGGERDRHLRRKRTKMPDSPGGAGPNSAAPASPEQAARLFLVSPDAELVCRSVLDPGLLKATYGDLNGCVAGRRPPTLTRDPGLGEPRVAGGLTRLSANPRGGLYDGQRLTFTIAEGEDGWLIERITSNVQVGP